jgi:hypothetical protein
VAQGFDKDGYVRWVQRSLNRIMGRSVPVDGRDIGPWREVLREFKLSLRIRDPGIADFQIGPNTQNQIIRLNHLSPDYVEWLHEKLDAGPASGDASAATRLAKAVRGFQAKTAPLKQDGWVGFATEAALMRRFGDPPGNGGPPPKPAPEWLQVWNALPVQVRYARWIGDMASRVGADGQMAGRLPAGGWDPVYKHFVGILAKNAKSTPKLLHFYFTDTDIGQIALASMPRVVENPPRKAAGGGKLLDQEALRQIARQMTSTEDLFRLTLGYMNTPAAYAMAQQNFEERVFETYKAIQSGFMKLAYLGNWGRQGFFDAKHAYILIIISTLSLREESVYQAFRHNLPNPESWEAPASLGGLLGLD